MHMDVVDLREFYLTPLGRSISQLMRKRLRETWPDVKGQDVLGIGYTTPFLAPFRSEAQRLISFMPAGQGVIRWPRGGANLTSLVEDTRLPLPDSSIDRILLAHSVESSEALPLFLQELWRVLSPTGRIIAVVPHRHGVWARSDATPFGHGHPYSKNQILRLLKNHQFTFEHCEQALFYPPFAFRFMVKSAAAFESVGRRVWSRYGGVMIVEATKQIYALPRNLKLARSSRRIRVLNPVPVRLDGAHRSYKSID